jgi:hypothetical protein
MAYNFMYLTPELGEYLHSNVPTAMQLAMSIYTGTASSPPDGTNDGPRSPYWMQSHSPEVQGEDGMEPYQQTHALFQAKARILKESQAELSKYLDSPIVPVGDLYYIDNLVAALDASTNPPPPTSPATPTAPPLPTFTPVPGDANGDKSVDILDYSLVIYQFGSDCEPPASCSANFNGDYAVDIFDYSILISNFGNSSPTPTPTLLPTATPTPLPSVTPRG